MSSQKKIHFWQRCHNCCESPIVGIRYQCQSCPAGPNIDLCKQCYELHLLGVVSHPKQPGLDTNIGAHEFLGFAGEIHTKHSEWCSLESVADLLPSVSNNFIVRMEFKVGYNSYFGGYGFVVNHSEERILLTALHVLDEVLKVNSIDATSENKAYTGKELPQLIDSTMLYDVMQDKWMFHELGECVTMLPLINARVGEREPISFKDVSAFIVPKSIKIGAERMAVMSPEVGEPVWLVANMPEYRNLRQAVVVDKTSQGLVFRYNLNDGLPAGCSGAPIVNEFGQVVGINIGTTTFSDYRFGHANPIESIRKHLDILQL